MLGLGLAISFTGYSLVYYGLTQLRGGNWGLLDLMIPSKWTPQTANLPMDNGSTLSGGVVAPTKVQSTITNTEKKIASVNPFSGATTYARPQVGQVNHNGIVVR